MKLYYSPGACSLSPHIVAREAGIPVELKKVDLKAKLVEGSADYLKTNGKGYVPAIELDDGSVLTEGPAIVQYLADRKPESGLAPAAGTMERYRLQEWLNFITSELHKAFGAFFSPALTPEWRKGVADRLELRCEWLAQQLAGKPYLMGDTFTVADAYAFTILNWAHMLRVELKPFPALVAYVARVGSRPYVREALVAEGMVRKAA